MITVRIVPQSEFGRVEAAALDDDRKLALIADMCRLNTLSAIKRAGSGHLGTSFSCMDLVVRLYWRELDVVARGIDHPDRDVYFSSKGHDAPGLYSVLFARGIITRDAFVNLRRIAGVPGHPDVAVPGIEANTGSLGMGISKGKGIALARKLAKRGGRVVVLTGDGELQEGQIWESLATVVNQRTRGLYVIIDHNKVQSDRLVSEISDLGRLEIKLAAFGWAVLRCDGNDPAAVRENLAKLFAQDDRPGILIADTLKGRGISFMEHPAALAKDGGLYRWHAGAPPDDAFEAGHRELVEKLGAGFAAAGLGTLALEDVEPAPAARKLTADSVAQAFGEELVELGRTHQELVVMTADLTADCRLREFERAFPERFVENGIAEQDMVSMAGGLALSGFLPIVNSFGTFLAARANEQIYTNATERTRIVYVNHFAGLLPAAPGHSHQSVRDIALFGSLPSVTILEPCCPAESRMAIRWLVEHGEGTGMLRLQIGPSPRAIALPPGYTLTIGRGAVLGDGRDAVLMTYGPWLVAEALAAAEKLAAQGVGLKVVAMPWLNRVDPEWFSEILGDRTVLVVAEDHHPVGGLADRLRPLLAAQPGLARVRLACVGVEGVPACGTPDEALAAHGLDGASLATRVLGLLERGGVASA